MNHMNGLQVVLFYLFITKKYNRCKIKLLYVTGMFSLV